MRVGRRAVGAVIVTVVALTSGTASAAPRGRVEALGNAGHIDGEGEGIDATKVGRDRLHVLTVDVNISPVWLGNLAVTGGGKAG